MTSREQRDKVFQCRQNKHVDEALTIVTFHLPSDNTRIPLSHIYLVFCQTSDWTSSVLGGPFRVSQKVCFANSFTL